MLRLEVVGDISVTTRDIRNPQSLPQLNWIERQQLPDAQWKRICAMIKVRITNPTDFPITGPTASPENSVKVSTVPFPALKNTFLVMMDEFLGDPLRTLVVSAPLSNLYDPDGKCVIRPKSSLDAVVFFDKTALRNHRPVVYDPDRGFYHEDDPYFMTIAFDPDNRMGIGNARPVAPVPVYLGSYEIRVVRNDPPPT